MSTDGKKGLAKERISRRAEILNPVEVLMPDIYGEDDPLEKDADADKSISESNDLPKIDSSEGFNPYDTGALYKK